MLIGVKHRFIFVANSKAASTSIERTLIEFSEINRTGSAERKHCKWQQAREEYGFLFDQPEFSPESFFRFGVIRDPLDWVVSWYNYRSGNKLSKNRVVEGDFEQFWKDDEPIRQWNQASQFTDKDGLVRFDLLIPYPHLSSTFPLVCRRIGIPATDLPRLNPSKVERVAPGEVSTQLANEIRQFYANDWSLYREAVASFPVELERLRAWRRPVAWEVFSSPLVDEQSIDDGANNCRIRGVVVPAKEVPLSSRLVLEERNGERPVGWGLPSGAIGKKWPGNPRAETARFEVRNCNCPANLLLEAPDGARTLLWRFNEASECA